MKHNRNVRFGDSPKGAQARRIIRNMDAMRRALFQAIDVVKRAMELSQSLDRINRFGGSAVDFRRLKDELDQLKMEYTPQYGKSIEDDLEDDGFYEDL